MFFCFVLWEAHRDEEHSKGEVHSGMSARRGIDAVRAEVRAVKLFYPRLEGGGLRQAGV